MDINKEQRIEKMKLLAQEKGHPLSVFLNENSMLEGILLEAGNALKQGNVDEKAFEKIRELAIHYAKKGDLLYPHLKVKYEISGPSEVMWTVDDEIRDEISSLAKNESRDEEWKKRYEAVLVRVDEMIYIENNILFPSCAANFTVEEWQGIYEDQKDYADCFGIRKEIWSKAEENKKERRNLMTGQEVVLAGGCLKVEQLNSMLNSMGVEITFVDDNDINRYFNEGPKDFKRPGMAIGRSVFSCHPPKVETKVRRIIDEFRAGNLDEVPVWMKKNGKIMLVKYIAVRDYDGKYMGTLELVQDMSDAKEYFLSGR